MRLSNLKISAKLALAFGILLLGVGAMGGVVYDKLSYIEDVRLYNRQVNAGWRDAIEARASLSRVENSLPGYLLSLDPVYIDKIKQHRSAFDERIARVTEVNSGSSDTRLLAEKAVSGAANWQRQVADEAIRMAEDPLTRDTARLMPMSEAASTLIDPTEQAIDGLIAIQKELAEANAEAQQNAYGASVLTLGAGVGVLALISIIGAHPVLTGQVA